MAVERNTINLETETKNKYSLAFEYFKLGKSPIDVVMDGILEPDEAQKLYKKFLELSNLKISNEIPPAPKTKVELTIEEWRETFKAFSSGMHPIEVVIEKNIDPEKVEYAYLKFLELSEKYIALTDHEWSLAFYFFEKGYKPLDLASRGVLTPKKAEYAYKKYLEFKKPKNLVVKEERTSLLEMEIPDRLVFLFFITSTLVDIEHVTAAIALMRTGAFGNLNPILLGLSTVFGPRIGVLTSMILMVLLLGVIMFVSAFYVKEKYRDYPLLIAAVLELIFTISHALHL